MSFTFARPPDAPIPTIVGICAPSGGGKSVSALELATGMAGSKPVLFINTEGPRGHMYRHDYDYLSTELGEPFTSERFMEALKDAAALDPGCLVIDCFSYYHDGPGGLQDRHEQNLTRMVKGRDELREKLSYGAWREPKASQQQLIYRMQQFGVPLVLTFLATEKKKMVKGAKELVDLGWQPIISKEIDRCTTITFMLPLGAEGVPDYNEQATKRRSPLIPIMERFRGKKISREMGAAIAEWAASQPISVAPAPPADEEAEQLRQDAERTAAAASMDWQKAITSCTNIDDLAEVCNACPPLEWPKWKALASDKRRELLDPVAKVKQIAERNSVQKPLDVEP